MLNKRLPLFLSVLLVLAYWTNGHAQELKAGVTISTPRLQTTDPAVFKTLEKDLRDFLNLERWTSDVYKPHERIDCNFSINVTAELGGNAFSADIAIKAVRPVYGTEYKTVLINHVDRDVIINYQEFQPIVNGTEFFRDNLSSVFSFYAQWIIGLDAESFAPRGGEPYFRAAQNIINQVPSVVREIDKGWQSLNRRTTRFWIMENMLSPRYASFREAWYNYHRKSLDIMHANPEQAVGTMVEALKQVDRTNVAYPNSIGVIMFVATKNDEIISIMKNADRTQKNTVFDIMRKLDPANSGRYNVIRG